MAQTAPTPLEGVRVVDISNFLAAPMVSMFLADYGAEVIKVERPDTGDEMRYWGNAKDGEGLYYKVINRNKKSVTADFRTPLGIDIVKRLVRDADLVVENYRPGTIEKWGLGYEVLRAINPRLILLRVTGFGQTGPNRDKPGFGTLAEAYAGFAHINGDADGPPHLPGFGLADSTTGLMGAYLALVALFEQKQSGGEGQVIDLAIYEPLYTLLGPQVVDFDQLGLVQGRQGSRLPFTSPRNTYRTRDGEWVAIAGSAQSIFTRICTTLGLPELIDDPRFANNRLRVTNAKALDQALQDAIAEIDLDDLLARFTAAEAAVAPVNSVADTFADPHFIARDNITMVEDGGGNTPLRMQNVVGKFSRTPGGIRHAGPRLGAHNREILVTRLGFREGELREAGIELD